MCDGFGKTPYTFYLAYVCSTADLEQIANATIHTETSIDNIGTVVTTFNQLDHFVEIAKSTYPELSDYEIATFLLDYTNQEYHDLPTDQILIFLTYDNITISNSYIRVDGEGDTHISSIEAIPYSDWESTDGYMKISTGYTHKKTVGKEKYYTVWARATWIKFPAIALQDAFAIGTTGTFDDSFDEFATVSQTYFCPKCNNRLTFENRRVTKASPVDYDLSLNYNNFVPAINFEALVPRCDLCHEHAKDHYFSAYLTYGVIADTSVNIQAGYGHTTIGLGDVSISIDNNGTPSFSIAGFKSHVVPYVARAVTLTY